MDWLGDTRETIGYEKAGIFRPNKPAICADPDPPESVLTVSQQMGANYIAPVVISPFMIL